MSDRSTQFSIPTMQSAADQAVAVVESPEHENEPEQKLAKILVVDDEIVTLRLLSFQLTEMGYEILLAETGKDALEVLAENAVDLILMDINMPVLDGCSTLRIIRQQHDSTSLPVIMMTSTNTEEQIAACFDCGASDYLPKPVRMVEMFSRFDAQLRLVNAQKALQESEQRYALATEGTRDGIWDWNLATGKAYLSPRWHEMTGLTEERTNHADSWIELVFHEDQERVRADLEAHLCGETPHFETELRMPDQRGGFRWMLCRGLAVRDEAGMATRIAGSLTDITEGKVADALTGLPNRTLFHDRASRCVEQFRRNGARAFALLYIDVNEFKLINDTLGHDVGDLYLQELSKRMDNCLRRSDAVLARLGGDEFGILIENISSSEDPLRVAERLQARVQVPFSIGGREILPRISIGVALMSRQVASVDDLIRQADTAMYDAKQFSQFGVSVFDERMQTETDQRLKISAELKHAVRRDEMRLHFQPIIDVRRMRTTGFEALLRWQHPIHGNIPPNDFIPIAESNGMILEIGKWVTQSACHQIADWNRRHKTRMTVAVNVSVRQLAVPGFVEQVCECVENSNIDPSQLNLEVTESLLMQKPEQTIGLLEKLQKAGVGTGIDDFGTGYSSLACLHQMPLNLLKIDRSFIVELGHSIKHQAIVRSIIALARSLELNVIAEGIETEEQAAYLKSMGCDFFQGYHYSRPVNALEAETFITTSWHHV